MAIKDIVDRPINVKDLEMPERLPQLIPFDPERDLTPEEIKGIRDTISWTDYYEETPFSLPFSFSMKPKSMDTVFNLLKRKAQDIDVESWVGVSEHSARKDLEKAVTILAKIRLLFPNRFDQVKFQRSSLRDLYLRNFINSALIEPSKFFKFKVLFPDYEISDNTWEQFKNSNFSEEFYDAARINPSRASFLIDDLAYFRLFAPDKYATLPKPDEQIWNNAKVRVKELSREPFLLPFLSRVETMTVLAADEARLTENGVEIVMRKPHDELVQANTPVPEERSF